MQSVLVVMMDDIKSNIKVWLDDCLLHTKTEDDLLETPNFFFKKYQEHGLKLHASKCVLFATTVRYFGRLITKDGVRFDPKNMEALQTMQEPQNGADVAQYVAAVNLMRSAIRNYSKRVAPLQATLTKVFEGKSRRTKKDAAALSLLHLWRASGFQRFTSSYHEVNEVGIPRPRQEDLCLDGCLRSLLFWLGDTIDEEEPDLPMEDQDHQPLAFLTGEFKGAQLRWTVTEKVGFAIVDTVTKV
jgi:hypothetical protein